MARGPRPMPTHLKLLRGNPAHERLRPEPEPRVAPAVPEPPEFLVGYAREEWQRIAPELYRLRCLTIVDLNTLAAYCQAYFDWRTALNALAKMRAVDPTTFAIMIKARTGTPMLNPVQLAADRAAASMVRYAAEFGCSPAARSRIAAAENTEGGKAKFAGLLAGV